MSKQNDLNVSLQGNTKLYFFKTHLLQNEISDDHLALAKVIEEQEDSLESFEEYAAVIDLSIKEYNERFTD